MNPIEIININKSFGTPPTVVLQNINLILPVGITHLMGASGIGKTTLTNLLMGFISPDSGTIKGLKGKKIAAVFQEDRLLEEETVLTNLLFVTPNVKKYTQKAIDLLTQAGLFDSLNKKAAELSGGMKRRVALCRALISNYDVLILDEPFKGLDEEIKPQIIKMVQQHALQAQNKIVLNITHDPAEAEALGGEIIILSQNK